MNIEPLYQSQDMTSSFGRQMGWRGIGLAGFAGVGEDTFAASLAAGTTDVEGFTLWATDLGRSPTAADQADIVASGDYSKLRIFNSDGDTVDVPVTASIFAKMTGYTSAATKIPWAIIGVAAVAVWFLFLRNK